MAGAGSIAITGPLKRKRWMPERQLILRTVADAILRLPELRSYWDYSVLLETVYSRRQFEKGRVRGECPSRTILIWRATWRRCRQVAHQKEFSRGSATPEPLRVIAFQSH
jgi:hypothetical protein